MIINKEIVSKLTTAPDYLIQGILAIDISLSMNPFLELLKREIGHFHRRTIEAFEVNGMYAEQIYIRIMTFSSIDEGVPITLSDYFYLPIDNEKLVAYVQNITSKGVSKDRDSLLAVYQSIKSDWIDKTDFFLHFNNEGKGKGRQFIMMFTDGSSRKLESYKNIDCPESLYDLGMMWEEKTGNYTPQCGRLVAFCPKLYPWEDICTWNRYWPFFGEPYDGLTDDFIVSAMSDFIVGSF